MLALSFRNGGMSGYGNITVVPPLLRREMVNHPATKGNYIHGYMLNSGYAHELVVWSQTNPKEQLHFFWDKKKRGEDRSTHPAAHHAHP